MSPGQVPEVTPDSRLTLRRLTSIPDRGEYIIGDPSVGRFFAIPAVGMPVLAALGRGETVAAAGAAASTSDAQVDALGFARTLVSVGFATAVDGCPVPAPPRRAEVRALPPAAAWLGRVLFGFRAWYGYTAVLAVLLVGFAVEPGLRPTFEDIFVDPRPAVSMAIVFGLGFTTAGLHELCHWWAARSLGAPARISLSRRLYLPVMQTDVSGLWALPARLRYGPFLAGIALDLMLLAAAVGVRWGWTVGLWDPAPELLRICGALAVTKLFTLMFQGWVFLRTDLYVVMITALGTRNLNRVIRLRLKALAGLASERDHRELAGAHPRDIAVSRWYLLVYLAGLLWAVWFFKVWFYPSSFVVISWMGNTLRHVSVGSGYWWQAVGAAVLVSTNIIWPLSVWLRQRVVARREGTT
jgi:putative peptide zinc metalloprotease protein